MLKIDIAERVAQATQLGRAESIKAVDVLFATVKAILAEGHSLDIRKFGGFSTRKKRERIGRNPKTKEPCTITARTVLSFKPSKQLKEKVNL
jgi:integration host factor subunit alpha